MLQAEEKEPRWIPFSMVLFTQKTDHPIRSVIWTAQRIYLPKLANTDAPKIIEHIVCSVVLMKLLEGMIDVIVAVLGVVWNKNPLWECHTKTYMKTSVKRRSNRVKSVCTQLRWTAAGLHSPDEQLQSISQGQLCKYRRVVPKGQK